MPFPDFSDIEQRIQHNYPNVDLTYNWKWPPEGQKILCFLMDPMDQLDKAQITEKLFQKFHDALKNAVETQDQSRVKKIIRLIVVNWGGIKGNADSTIDRYAMDLIGNTLLNDISNGIASKSKILAAWDPDQYYIYDSRVAIALQKLYLDQYKFKIPTPNTGNNKAKKKKINETIRKLTRQTADNAEAVDYLNFCAGLRNTGRGSEWEKKLFMLGGYIEQHGLA